MRQPGVLGGQEQARGRAISAGKAGCVGSLIARGISQRENLCTMAQPLVKRRSLYRVSP